MKKKLFTSIFDQLDSDQDGVLSSTQIETNALDLDLLKVLDPILIEIEENGERHTEKSFLKRCKKLYDGLDPAQRSVILKYKKHHCESLASPQ